MDEELERRQLREACLQAMPHPGESALRVTLFQWAREASPGRVLRLLNTIDKLKRQLDAQEVDRLQQMSAEATREDDVVLRMALEEEWNNCIGIAKAFHRAVKNLPGTWPPALRDAMQRAEAAGLHRFD